VPVGRVTFSRATACSTSKGGEPGRPQPLPVQLDPDLAIDAAADVDGSDTGDLLEPARQLVLEKPGHLLQVAGRRHRQAHDFDAVEVELEDTGSRGLEGQLVPKPVESRP
jgi:hypothetical protein